MQIIACDSMPVSSLSYNLHSARLLLNGYMYNSVIYGVFLPHFCCFRDCCVVTLFYVGHW